MRNMSAGAGLAVLVVGFFVSCFLLLSLWTDRTLDFWMTYWKGETVDVPFWLSAVLTLVLNGIILTLNLVSEILRLVV